MRNGAIPPVSTASSAARPACGSTPGDRFVWTIDATPGPIEVETRLVEDRPDELLAWRSVDEAEIDVEIKLQLRDAPAARGTEAEAHVAWRPRWGWPGITPPGCRAPTPGGCAGRRSND